MKPKLHPSILKKYLCKEQYNKEKKHYDEQFNALFGTKDYNTNAHLENGGKGSTTSLMKDMFSKMENVILTPHIGGITEESRERVVSCVCKDVAAVLQGERPIHAVNSIRF